jgi:hypothetical protein
MAKRLLQKKKGKFKKDATKLKIHSITKLGCKTPPITARTFKKACRWF